MNFRKKPVVIQAYHFVDGLAKFIEWMEQEQFRSDVVAFQGTDKAVYIDTLEGNMKADRGDWIIRGVKGEYYPCKPDVFEITYERVDDPSLRPSGEEK